jgi:predicted transcriptional regulator
VAHKAEALAVIMRLAEVAVQAVEAQTEVRGPAVTVALE